MLPLPITATIPATLNYDSFKQQVLADYEIALKSRQVSLLGRKEVLSGKAKFGIFGDGKEVAQLAWSKFFNPGDYRSGYYRDQTFMLASHLVTVEQLFAQLYANVNPEQEPMSSGRQMNGHFATAFVQPNGEMANLAHTKNISADMAPTASQMPRALGLALTSKIFKNTPTLQHLSNLSTAGNEICFCTIGDASTSEGHFWETLNAAGVLQVPLAVLVWDNGFGISVPKEYQTIKGSISEAVSGFQQTNGSNGIDIYNVKGWDYASLCETMETAFAKCRNTHTPCLIHVDEITQPQGHSTSGSHERYKTNERLQWEKEWDCLKKMKEWMIENEIATVTEIDTLEQRCIADVKQAKQIAWQQYLQPIQAQVQLAISNLTAIATHNPLISNINTYISNLQALTEPLLKDVTKALRQLLITYPNLTNTEAIKQQLLQIITYTQKSYHSNLYNEGIKSATVVATVPPTFTEGEKPVNGYEVLNHYFDTLLAQNPLVYAFGEDVGQIGDVNQGFAGLQQKHGNQRVFDTGIRETTIIGQGIGMALRGLRPIAEIQYLDYVLYALQTLSDDVSSLHYRTNGLQSCPLIVRTRGHRLEGIWHSGSPMGMLLNALRGMYIAVPRNMVQAIGIYNTLLQSNDPALVIECLNGYRLKEQQPTNILEYTVPLGIPEILQPGTDITIVSYGSTLRIVTDAAALLQSLGVSAEVIDAQTLLPFDITGIIGISLQKTNRILFVDEDVPGGATAYMYNQVIEQQQGYKHLDCAARTLTAKAHRPPYGSDGDYFSKPSIEDVVEIVMEIMAD